MAVVGSSSQQASSSGTKVSDSPYRVFLSFRGEDTRYTFADHLYTALEGAGIRTFRDVDEIEKGKRIDSEIKNAIEASQSSVIVFSKDFASSIWCLEEVAMIMDRAETYGPKYLVLPVFYHVDPAHVRHQIGSYGEAFAAHESKFRERRRAGAEEWTERVSRWKDALSHAADLSGMDLKSQAGGYEAKFIEKIVAEIQAVGLENLKDRCLLEFDESDVLVMHQMVRDMGREICRKEKPNDPGERRRLWCHCDSMNVLEEKTGTRNIEALVLDGGEQNKVDNATTEVLQKNPLMYLIEFCCRSEKEENYLETVALKEMKKLRMLHMNFLGGLNLKGSYENFPNKIRWLRLDGWPLVSIPDDFPARECIAIEIRYSGLTKLGLARTKVFIHLKILNLSYNKGLTRILEFSRFPNLESLDLKECVNLKEVDESIGKLKESLKYLGLENCTSLHKLPRTIVMLCVLKTLKIAGCTNLEEFPENMDQMKALTYFGASGIIMNQEVIIPRILTVDISLISTVPILPWGALPGSLTRLTLKGCGLSENCFPRSFDNLPFLEDLYLGDNPICFLPECIKGLALLNEISFHKCERLESLVGLPEVSTLEVVDCVSLKQVTYQASAGLKTVTKTRGCGELICLQHKYKPIPINSIGNYLLDAFRFINWEAMESTNITFYNNTSFATRKGPIQGVEEACGVLSISFPGSQVHVEDKMDAKDLDAERNNHCLVVEVPSCHPHSDSISMYMVTLCFVYSSSLGVEIGRVMDGSISAVISNTSKQLKLVFDPSWNGYKVEESAEDLHMTWVISNWILGDDKLQPGDVLKIYVTGRVVWNFHVKVKKFACNFIGIDMSKQVHPVQATRHYAETLEDDDHIFFYGNPDLRDWD